MEVESILLNMASEISDAEIVKNQVLSRLLIDGVITQEQYDEYTYDWQILVIKKGWFKKWCDKYRNGQDNQWIYKYVRFEDKVTKPTE